MRKPVRPANLAICIGLLLAAPGVARAQSSSARQPKLVLAEPIFDFGQVNSNAVLTHEFVLRNEGDAELVISSLVPGCACTAASSDPVIPPAAAGKIRVELDVSGLSGAIGKQVSVFTNDPNASRTILTVRALIASPTFAKPETLRLTAVENDQAGSATVTLWVSDRDDLVVTRIESPSAYIKITFRELLGGDKDADGKGRQWRLDAVLDPAAPLGAINGLARVHTNHPTASVITVPVSGFVRPMRKDNSGVF